ncbi:hypothetical protein D3C87_1005580 [compost metagenome]
MSETWFRIAPWSKAAKITEETFEKSTGSFLTPERGPRVAKSSAYSQYYPTWDEAHQALLEETEKDLTQARRALERAQGFHGNVKGMKKS